MHRTIEELLDEKNLTRLFVRKLEDFTEIFGAFSDCTEAEQGLLAAHFIDLSISRRNPELLKAMLAHHGFEHISADTYKELSEAIVYTLLSRGFSVKDETMYGYVQNVIRDVGVERVMAISHFYFIGIHNGDSQDLKDRIYESSLRLAGLVCSVFPDRQDDIVDSLAITFETNSNNYKWKEILNEPLGSLFTKPLTISQVKGLGIDFYKYSHAENSVKRFFHDHGDKKISSDNLKIITGVLGGEDSSGLIHRAAISGLNNINSDNVFTAEAMPYWLDVLESIGTNDIIENFKEELTIFAERFVSSKNYNLYYDNCEECRTFHGRHSGLLLSKAMRKAGYEVSWPSDKWGSASRILGKINDQWDTYSLDEILDIRSMLLRSQPAKSIFSEAAKHFELTEKASLRDAQKYALQYEHERYVIRNSGANLPKSFASPLADKSNVPGKTGLSHYLTKVLLADVDESTVLEIAGKDKLFINSMISLGYLGKEHLSKVSSANKRLHLTKEIDL